MTTSTPPPDSPPGAPRDADPGSLSDDANATEQQLAPPGPGSSTQSERTPPVDKEANVDDTGAPTPRTPLSAGLWLTIVVALLFGAWGLWTVVAPTPDTPAARAQGQAQQIEGLQQKVATLSRSDQISRDANRDVQGTLAERDEEIAALRADVAFYERFVGATGQRRGLTVHELQLQPQSDTAWHFTATLTQNLNRGAVSSGRAVLSVEGMQAGKLRRLDWAALRQQPAAPGVEYSFKYFQQIEGDVVLPPGFTPLRVRVRLSPQGGAPVEQSFAWADALKSASDGA